MGKTTTAASPQNTPPVNPAASDELERAAIQAAVAQKTGKPLPQLRSAAGARSARPRREPDPLQEAHEVAKQMRGQEEAAKAARLRQRVDRYEDGTRRPAPPRRPVRAFARRQRPDTTTVYDSQGQPLQMPGMILRWVTETDSQGRPSQQRVGDFNAYGYEIVKDPHTGKEIRSIYGVLMAGAPEAYAERMLDHAPEGAIDSADLLGPTYEAAKALNRAAGQQVVHFGPEQGHGSRRRGEVVTPDAEYDPTEDAPDDDSDDFDPDELD